MEARGGLRSGREFDSLLTPRGRADRHALLVQARSGVLDEANFAATSEKASDRGVVADVGGDPEDHDLGRIEPLEEAAGVRVREDIEALLQEQELPAGEVPLG